MRKTLIALLLLPAIIFFAATQINASTANNVIKKQENFEVLRKQAPKLNPKILNLALTAYMCAKKLGIEHNGVLTIIDFSKPSNQERLWLFDMENNKLLYHTYVAHGINSGKLYANRFSNVPDSRQSSIGLYKTGGKYTGKHGHSLKLHGLEPSYNDKAFPRFIVVHKAWYVSKTFINRYGRLGRSWGCPVITDPLNRPIIEAIRDGSLLLIYYPDKKWLSQSRFLNCKID